MPNPPGGEVVTSVVYISYFIVPYAMAAILWVRDRAVWRRYAVFPGDDVPRAGRLHAATCRPPWAAARCTAEQVVDHPRDPPCMHSMNPEPGGGLLGKGRTPPRRCCALCRTHLVARLERAQYPQRVAVVHDGAGQVESGRGDSVAARGLTMLLALFMWPRVKALGKTLFMAYPLAMAFALVVHRRALRHRHPARLGTGGECDRGVSVGGSALADTPAGAPTCDSRAHRR